MRLRGKQLDAINAAIKAGGDVGAAFQHTCEQADAIGKPPPARLATLLAAAEKMDWRQVVANGGPPCFHVCEDGRFCGRTPLWEGHDMSRPTPVHHAYVSLADLLTIGR